MMLKKKPFVGAALGVLLGMALGVRADSITYSLTNFDAGDGSAYLLEATATFTVSSAGNLKIQISNTSPETRSNKETIAGLLINFKPSPSIGTLNLVSSSAIKRTITSSSSYSDSALTSTDWTLNTSFGTLGLNPGSPDQLVIGPATGYAHINSSIINDSPALVNPTFYLTAGLQLTSVSQIASVYFEYATGGDKTLGTPGSITPNVVGTPLPKSALAGVALLGVIALRRKPAVLLTA